MTSKDSVSLPGEDACGTSEVHPLSMYVSGHELLGHNESPLGQTAEDTSNKSQAPSRAPDVALSGQNRDSPVSEGPVSLANDSTLPPVTPSQVSRNDASSSAEEKMTVVRVKRKRGHISADTIWVETIQSSRKRPHGLDMRGLTLQQHKQEAYGLTSDPASIAAGAAAPTSSTMTTTTRQLFKKVETLSFSSMSAAEAQLSLAARISKIHGRKRAADQRREHRHESHPHPASLKPRASSLKGTTERQLAHAREHRQVLCPPPSLPLSPPPPSTHHHKLADNDEDEEYEYDVYCLQDQPSDRDRDANAPTVQVLEDEEFESGERDDSDHDSEDSNGEVAAGDSPSEDNPLNDYPEDEDSDGDDGQGDRAHKGWGSDDSAGVDPYGSDSEDYDTVAFDKDDVEDDDHIMRWKPRK
eukprot:jgi/Mesen1/7906/ME000420S07049